ncbi:RNAse P Rpr2/Rpp21/SNM1 subunit domain-containing protein [Fennellomyces sp. T-0311]|nr:RNAse P Rpr2/Rpp21/SNM1 subunit domain-containing protein [Fennellomyces sp. T-0311]
MTEVKAQSSRMEYLFQASHAVFAQCPELSRFYMSEFQQCMRQQDLIPAKSITRTCCPRCGQIYVPGLNTSVKLQTRRTKKKRNQLIYQCNACTHKMMFQGSSVAAIPKADLSKTTAVTPATMTTLLPSPIEKKKKKNKGGKKNQLQAMLASRQQKEAEKKGGGLGLDDFLSSL